MRLGSPFEGNSSAVGQYVTGIVTGVASLYVAATLSQVFLQPDLQVSPILNWMVASSLALLGVRLLLWRWPLSARRVHVLGIITTFLIIYNTLFHLYLLFGVEEHIVHWILLGLGISTYLLPARQVVMVLAVTLCAWIALIWVTGVTEGWLYFAFGLFTAAGLKVHAEFQENKLQRALQSAAVELTRRHETESQLIHQASHDSLTRLPNRALFLERLKNSLQRSQSTPGYQFAVLFLDLDRFKVVNDSLGHLVGDELLQRAAQRLRESLRPADTVARLGGDEFAVLLENVRDLSEARKVADRIRERFAQPFSLANRAVFTSAGIGIAVSGPSYEKPEELLRDADTALYRAKNTGPASCQVFDSEMHEEALKTMQLEHDLHAAITKEEFLFHYQPMISMSTGEIVAAEALLRWNHPRRGLLLPGDFLPLAEETGLSVKLGFWGLREICKKAREWQTSLPLNPPLSVGFNLSAAQFSHPDFLDAVAAALEESQLAPELLKLEITETIIMSNLKATRTVLSDLREQGIQIYLDDFGTGYSSLSHLHRLPFDAAKFDRSFISGTRLVENYQIVKAMTQLIHSLGMLAVAEGVETIRQAAVVKELNCDFGQGRYFSYPLDCRSFEALLQSDRPVREVFARQLNRLSM